MLTNEPTNKHDGSQYLLAHVIVTVDRYGCMTFYLYRNPSRTNTTETVTVADSTQTKRSTSDLTLE